MEQPRKHREFKVTRIISSLEKRNANSTGASDRQLYRVKIGNIEYSIFGTIAHVVFRNSPLMKQPAMAIDGCISIKPRSKVHNYSECDKPIYLLKNLKRCPKYAKIQTRLFPNFVSISDHLTH